jgi:hypothetical protein
MTQQQSVRKNKEIRQKREPSRLTGKLDASLLTYAIAAAAAGVGMVTPQVAEAEVVATAANITVPNSGELIQIDINRDGQMDFGLSWAAVVVPGQHRKTCSMNCPPPVSSMLRVEPTEAANEVWQTGSKAGVVGASIYCAAALGAGRRVGPAAAFAPGNKAMFWYYGNFATNESACPWRGTHPPKPYLGVKFLDTSGNVHYGWVRISRGAGGVTITGYAYETTPNRSIDTGVTHGASGEVSVNEPVDLGAPGSSAPASLGMLALGAPGLVAWRRWEEELPAA